MVITAKDGNAVVPGFKAVADGTEPQCGVVNSPLGVQQLWPSIDDAGREQDPAGQYLSVWQRDTPPAALMVHRQHLAAARWVPIAAELAAQAAEQGLAVDPAGKAGVVMAFRDQLRATVPFFGEQN